MKPSTRENLKIVLAAMFAIAVITAAVTIRYAINSARFPESPWWSRFF